MKYPIISDQVNARELRVILESLQVCLAANVMGDVVEFGCYKGTTSLFLQRLLAETGRQLHVYDSFAGLPSKAKADESLLGAQYVSGELKATKAEFIKNFKQAGLTLPVIHKGWFNQLSINDLPRSICFAYLDGDFYESIKDSLSLVWPKLAKGALIVVDDYTHQGLPGAKRAVDEWLISHVCKLRVQESLAVLMPAGR